MASKAELENAMRNDVMENIKKMIEEHYGTDALQVSANEIAIPLVDAENNEKWAVVKVSIPRGTRNGEGGYDAYDGYAAAEDYRLDLADKAAKKAASEAKKKAAADARERKKEAKKVVKDLNDKGLNAMIHES